MKKTLKLFAVLLLYILSTNLLAQNRNKVYYIVYIIVNKTKAGSTEDSYRTDMMPATLSTKGYKKLKAARKKMWSNSSTTIRTIKRKLSSQDRVIIIKYNFKISSGKYSRIEVKKYSKKSKDYKISISDITSKYKSSSMEKEYYQNYETLYDGMPFTNSAKERKIIKENVKKATAIGVRG